MLRKQGVLSCCIASFITPWYHFCLIRGEPCSYTLAVVPAFPHPSASSLLWWRRCKRQLMRMSAHLSHPATTTGSHFVLCPATSFTAAGLQGAEKEGQQGAHPHLQPRQATIASPPRTAGQLRSGRASLPFTPGIHSTITTTTTPTSTSTASLAAGKGGVVGTGRGDA